MDGIYELMKNKHCIQPKKIVHLHSIKIKKTNNIDNNYHFNILK